MLIIDDDKTINLNRGDVAIISVSAEDGNEEDYIFTAGDVVRLTITKAKDTGAVVLQKDVVVGEEATTIVDISLGKEDTKIGELINKPVTYWYEIEVNPDTNPQTIIGYDKSGPKKFILYPEGGDV